MGYSKKRIDPEPFGIAIGIAGIVGGFAAALSLYRDFCRSQFRRSHRSALSTINQIDSLLDEIQEHITIMEKLSEESIELETQQGGTDVLSNIHIEPIPREMGFFQEVL